MKWYEVIVVTVTTCVISYVIFAPWLSIIDIHKSIDSLTDEVRKWREDKGVRE